MARRLPRTADRGDARRTPQALARRLRAHADRRLFLPRHRDGSPPLAAAPNDAEGDARRRRAKKGAVAGTIYQAFTLSFARTVVSAVIRDPRLVERYLNESEVGLIPVVS